METFQDLLGNKNAIISADNILSKIQQGNSIYFQKGNIEQLEKFLIILGGVYEMDEETKQYFINTQTPNFFWNGKTMVWDANLHDYPYWGKINRGTIDADTIIKEFNFVFLSSFLKKHNAYDFFIKEFKKNIEVNSKIFYSNLEISAECAFAFIEEDLKIKSDWFDTRGDKNILINDMSWLLNPYKKIGELSVRYRNIQIYNKKLKENILYHQREAKDLERKIIREK